MADLVTVPASVGSTNGATGKGTAGETLVAGDTVYKNKADGRLWKADANLSIDTARTRGVAAAGAAAGQPVHYWKTGDVTLGVATVAGTVYVQSATPGKIAPAADLLTGLYATIIGIGMGNQTIRLAVTPSDQLVP